MRHTFLLLVTAIGLTAADVVTVDPAGTVIVAGTTPGAPATGEVRLGNGQVKAQGTVNAGDVTINRTGQASGAQAVRGDDPRMSNARPANGGNANTVQNRAPGATTGSGLATLENGKIPSEQLPPMAAIGLPQGYQAYTAPGTYTFTVPASTTLVYAAVVGGGGGAGGSKPPGTYTAVWIPGGQGGAGARLMTRIPVSPGQTIQVTVGGFGAGGNGGGTSSNQAKDNQGGGGGGGGSQVVYGSTVWTAGGGGGGGGAKSGTYTGYANRGGNGGNAMLNGETVTAGQAGGAGATIGVTLNGGTGGPGGVNVAPYTGGNGGSGNTGGFLDEPFWFLFMHELGNAGAGGLPNLTNAAWGTPGGSGQPGAVLLRW